MYAFSAYGLLLVDIGRATILIYATPIWAVALGPLVLREKLNIWKIGCVALGCIGISFVILPTISSQPLVGFVVLLAASLCWALAMLITKRNLVKADQVHVVVWQTVIGALGLAIITPFVDGGFVFEMNYASVLTLLYVAIFGTIVAMSLWFFIVQRVEMIQSSLASLAVPILVIIIDTWISGRAFDWGLTVGSVLIVCSILIVWLQPKTAPIVTQHRNPKYDEVL